MGLMGSWGWNLTAGKGEERRGRGRGGRGQEVGEEEKRGDVVRKFFLSEPFLF